MVSTLRSPLCTLFIINNTLWGNHGSIKAGNKISPVSSGAKLSEAVIALIKWRIKLQFLLYLRLSLGIIYVIFLACKRVRTVIPIQTNDFGQVINSSCASTLT